ncbi:MAG: hypothetical protein RLZZ175_165 [Bacteroidota bacterium]|jgi:outer membrane biosynthesis protein TonB
MFVDSKDDKKNNLIGFGVSIFVHGLLLLIGWFIFAYKVPNPPVPPMGEISFGFSDEGAQGDRIMHNSPQSDAVPQEQTPEEAQPEEDVPQQAVTNENSDGASIKEEPKKEKKEKKKSTSNNNSQSVATNPKGTYDPNKPITNGSGGGLSDAGLKGDPKGSYTGDGGAGGTSLNMAGWAWDDAPKPNDNSKETGKVVIELDIDDKGEILNARVLESTLSSSIANKYRLAVMNTNFHKTDNGVAPPKTTGKITFLIRSR